MAGHATIGALVVNLRRREELKDELIELFAERADLIAQAKAAGVPLSEIEGAAGPLWREVDAALARAVHEKS
jgi:hypothetical protein